jgi:hypothetical protein
MIAYGGDVNASGEGPVTGFDEARLDGIMGQKGKEDNGVYGFSLPRRDRIYDMGVELSPAMDISSDVSFQPVRPEESALVGELVLEASEVEPVIRTLSKNNIEVMAVHSHMLTEEPRLFFMHFWANDDALKLAKALRAAVDQTK